MRELIIADEDAWIAKEDLKKFFHGVAHNRSIKKLRLGDSSLSDGEVFNIMIPFFKNNLNFEYLKLDDSCDLDHECCHSIVTALAKFDSRKEFVYRCNMDNDDEAREIIQALTVH